MTVRTNDSYPRAWDAVMKGFDAAIRAEKARRQAARDKYSLHRFETLTARFGREAADPEAGTRAAEELKAAAARGEDWTQSFWQWHYPPLARLAIAFLRGEHLRPPDAEGPTAATAADDTAQMAAAETVTAPTAAASPQSAPQTSVAADAAVSSAECWEPRWGAEQIAAVWSWQRDGAPPRAFLRTLGSMNAAVARERDRRREVGDAASVERFEREMQIADETTRAQEDSWRDELFAALSRHEVSFWDCLPPRMAALTRRFLRGEDAGAERRGYREHP
ncbi:MAG: hypothetical protein ACM37V_00490 [Gemmatimonadota bacterium]